MSLASNETVHGAAGEELILAGRVGPRVPTVGASFALIATRKSAS